MKINRKNSKQSYLNALVIIKCNELFTGNYKVVKIVKEKREHMAVP